VRALVDRLLADAAVLSGLDVLNLRFDDRGTPVFVLLIIVGLSLAAMTVRLLRETSDRRLVLPAVLARRPSALPLVRHLPLLIAITAIPPFMLALADPFTALVEQRMIYPGRRIALLIDASSSMLKPFADEAPATRNRAAFFSSVNAAETFIRQRQAGQYRDVIALIEFGDEAYVITPFTTDYDNVLLAASLIGDWSEFMRFPNQGTKMAAAIQEGTKLFETFKFTQASGNLMIIFSDGEDTQVTLQGRRVEDIMKAAVASQIPVYLVRTNRDKREGDLVPDQIWKPAVESTGGRFYAAANEQDVARAIEDIDRRSPGKIEVNRYATNERRFAPFALLAAALWSVALLLKLTVPIFRAFP
jgi:hypothetical protein